MIQYTYDFENYETVKLEKVSNYEDFLVFLDENCYIYYEPYEKLPKVYIINRSKLLLLTKTEYEKTINQRSKLKITNDEFIPIMSLFLITTSKFSDILDNKFKISEFYRDKIYPNGLMASNETQNNKNKFLARLVHKKKKYYKKKDDIFSVLMYKYLDNNVYTPVWYKKSKDDYHTSNVFTKINEKRYFDQVESKKILKYYNKYNNLLC